MKKSLGAGPMAYPQVVFLVGTYDENGVPDVMTVAWGGISSGEPPCVQVNIRPQRKTMSNIEKGSAITVGIPSAEHTAIADYFGLESGHNCNTKIEKAGVTAIPAAEALAKAGSEAAGADGTGADEINAPVIEELKRTLVCKVINTFELGSHIQVTGQIIDVLADEEILDDKGIIDIKKLDPILYDHSAREYYGVGEKTGDAYTIGLQFK